MNRDSLLILVRMTLTMMSFGCGMFFMFQFQTDAYTTTSEPLLHDPMALAFLNAFAFALGTLPFGALNWWVIRKWPLVHEKEAM